MFGQTVIDLWPNLLQVHACLELMAPPIERFQNSFTHMVQHCYETYPASFVMIEQAFPDL